ncbi:MAG: DUF2293 domain-containing protein [Bryobacteraceae bacterium]
MNPVLVRSGRPLDETDILALAEYLRSVDPGERQLHRLLEAHPAIIGALGFLEFLSEFPLASRDDGNRPVLDPRYCDRADIVAARLDIAPDLRARKFANLIELKGANANVLDTKTGRRSRFLSSAVDQLRDYSHWLAELPTRTVLASLDWDVWRPGKIVIMGSRTEFREPGQLEQVKQDLLETDGVQLILTDELLAIAEMGRRRPMGLGDQVRPFESLFGLNDGGRFLAPLIVASGGLGGLMLARRRLKDVLTSYGNVDIREGVPSGLKHLAEKRLQPLARKLGIPYAEAVVEIRKFRRDEVQMYGAIKSGIVVADYDASAMQGAFEQREVRRRPLRERERQRRRESSAKKVELARAFADEIKAMFPLLPEQVAASVAVRATKPNSGRVGTQSSLRLQEAVWLAVAAYAAYGHLRLPSKEAADKAGTQVRALLRDWGGPDPTVVLRSALQSRQGNSIPSGAP